jgi:hypothetical protein
MDRTRDLRLVDALRLVEEQGGVFQAGELIDSKSSIPMTIGVSTCTNNRGMQVLAARRKRRILAVQASTGI